MFKLKDEELRLISNYFRLNLYRKVKGFKLYEVEYSGDIIHLEFKKDKYKISFSISKYFISCRLYKKINGNLTTLDKFDAKKNPKIKDIREVIMKYTNLDNYKSSEDYIDVGITWDEEEEK